jgi:hypothetical protein
MLVQIAPVILYKYPKYNPSKKAKKNKINVLYEGLKH